MATGELPTLCPFSAKVNDGLCGDQGLTPIILADASLPQPIAGERQPAVRC
jgi:hypothetical protein